MDCDDSEYLTESFEIRLKNRDIFLVLFVFPLSFSYKEEEQLGSLENYHKLVFSIFLKFQKWKHFIAYSVLDDLVNYGV